jgi:hypothetical protein
MARVRDHRAAYARRTREARAEAERTGQPLDLRAARGHGGKAAKASKPVSKPAAKPSGKSPAPRTTGPMKRKLLSTVTRSDLPDVPPPLRQGGRKPKPLDQLSAPVRKRYEAYARNHGVSLDASRQKARGHRPGENRRRKEAPVHTTLTGDLTRGQKAYLRAFFNREIVSRHGDWDEDEQAAEWQRFLGQSTLAGWEETRRRMRIQTQLAAAYKSADNEHRQLGYRQVDLAFWGNDGADDGWDWTWFWYH